MIPGGKVVTTAGKVAKDIEIIEIIEIMKFGIKPYVAVGPLVFGMTKSQTEKAIGHVDRAVDSPRDLVKLYNFSHDVVAQVRKKSDQLVEVGFGPSATNVILESIHFFEQSKNDVVRRLYRIDSNAFTGHGSIVFLNIGVSLTGFEIDDDASERAVTAFSRGLWDIIIPSMKPFCG